MYKGILILALFFFGGALELSAQVQAPALSKDSNGRLVYRYSVYARGKSKEALYRQARQWLQRHEEVSDNWLMTDDVGHDSLKTVAYLRLENTPELKNQVVSFALLLRFSNGLMEINTSGFVFHALLPDNTPVDPPLVRLADGTDAAGKAAYFGFEKRFGNTMQSLITFR